MGDPEKRLNSRGHQRELQRQAAAYTGAGGGCLMALLLLPFTASLSLGKKSYPCANCGGSGKKWGATCSRCGGSGKDPYANR